MDGHRQAYDYTTTSFTSEISRNILIKFGNTGFPKICESCLIFVHVGHFEFSIIFGENRGSFIF